MSNVLTYLEKSAERLPDKIAFADVKEAVTYREILNRSRDLGKILKNETGENRPVAVLMDKSVACVSLFFGIVYAGGCYSLVDPKHPLIRIDQILEVLEPMILVTDREHLEMCQDFQFLQNGGKVLVLEELVDAAGKAGDVRCVSGGYGAEHSGGTDVTITNGMDKSDAGESRPLYINFTSGSTGVPKGVCVGHDSVVEFIDSFVEVCGITEDDVIGNQAPFDFDVSVKDIYATICVGATMQIIPKKYFSFPTMLLDYLVERKVTTLIWAVSALCIVTTVQGFEYKIPVDVRKVIFSGEIMPLKHLNQWMETLPDAKFFNVYGPTEITCNCTYYEVPAGKPVEDMLPIGRAFPGEDVFLLEAEGAEEDPVLSDMIEEDEVITLLSVEADDGAVQLSHGHGTLKKKQICIQPNEIGKVGELCVGGGSLALGYYRNPLQTRKAFVLDPRITSQTRKDSVPGPENVSQTDSIEPMSYDSSLSIKESSDEIIIEETEKFSYIKSTSNMIYRTGDLAYYMEDGNLMFVGRRDFQIKHMGHRIELSEIELALERLPGMVRSCVLYREESQQIIAFYEGELKRKDIMKGLKDELPAFMVPNKFVQMEHLPLSKNGKIDRKLLKEQL